MSKYENIDAEIMRSISKNPIRFYELFTGDVRAQCESINVSDGKDLDEAFRVLDRRLQSLRKAGLIKSTYNGWVLSGSDA